jgi:exodeoxyribonuclease-5
MVSEQQIIDYKVGLNQGQSEGFDKIVDFLKIENSITPYMFVLKGAAGTGKTFLSSRIIDYIYDSKTKFQTVCVSAPTNKALRVIDERLAASTNKTILSKTVYQVLGLREKISSNGTRTFEKDNSVYPPINDINYLIVDETSMLSDDIYRQLAAHAHRIKIIFMGDPYQIPPIGSVSSIPFSAHSGLSVFITHELNEVMRQQAGNPIIKLSVAIRNNQNQKWPIPNLVTEIDPNDHTKGVIVIDGLLQRNSLLPFMNQFFNCEEFRDNPDHCKVIAWRKKTVEYLNNKIRQMIYPPEYYEFDLLDYGSIMEGEKLIANSPIFEDKSLIFNTSDEFEVVSYKIKEQKLDGLMFKLAGMSFKYYYCKVAYKSFNRILHRTISVLHEDDRETYDKWLLAMKTICIEKGDKSLWVKYYKAQQAFADVAYNYAITAHKSQGSTYKNVFVIEDDIDFNMNIVERNKIKYTSYTRPTDKLFIFKSVTDATGI